MTQVKEYLRTAAECRELADKAMSPTDRAHWLKLAEQWLVMADEAEEHPDAFKASGRSGRISD